MYLPSSSFSLVQEDFQDDIKATDNTPIKKSQESDAQAKSQTTTDGGTIESKTIVSDSTILDLLDISSNELVTDKPSETDCLLDIFSNASNGCRTNNTPAQSSSNLLTFDFLKKFHGSSTAAAAAAATSCIPSSTSLSPTSSSSLSEANKAKGVTNKSKMSDKKASAWMDLFAGTYFWLRGWNLFDISSLKLIITLFADLDPLSNPTAMEKKIAGSNQNCLDA